MAANAFNGTNLTGLVADYSLAQTRHSFEFDPAGNQVTAENAIIGDMGGNDCGFGTCEM